VAGHDARWRDYYLGHDQTGPYAYLKKVLQVLTHLKGPNRWAIKCPQHMEHLAVLYKTFPDATFVMAHRDPSPRSSRRSPNCATTAHLPEADRMPTSSEYSAHGISVK